MKRLTRDANEEVRTGIWKRVDRVLRINAKRTEKRC